MVFGLQLRFDFQSRSEAMPLPKTGRLLTEKWSRSDTAEQERVSTYDSKVLKLLCAALCAALCESI
jgi:hypothetical protein